jgi:hypothetical protein
MRQQKAPSFSGSSFTSSSLQSGFTTMVFIYLLLTNAWPLAAARRSFRRRRRRCFDVNRLGASIYRVSIKKLIGTLPPSMSMEELQAKLAALKETRDAILKEKKIHDDKAYELSNASNKLQNEMWDIEQQIRKLSPVLSSFDKEDLKRDFEYIMSIIKGLKDESDARQDRNLYMYLKHTEVDYEEKWSTSLNGSLEDMIITIYTKSEHVKYAVRRAFRQRECSCKNIEYTEKENMERTRWFHGSNGGCLSFIVYVADSQSPSK